MEVWPRPVCKLVARLRWSWCYCAFFALPQLVLSTAVGAVGIMTVSMMWMTPLVPSISTVVTDGQVEAVHGRECVGGHDVTGEQTTRDHVIGQNRSQQILALRQQQVIDRSFRKLGEGVVGRSEHGEQSIAFQHIDEFSRLQRCDQRY